MISVVIPAYKNSEELVENLKKNSRYLKDQEVIIVNDFPDHSLKEVLSEFDWIKLIENNKNLGFGGAVNAGVKNATHKYVMLLNTDVILKDDSYKKTLKHFEKDDSLFAVALAQKEINGAIVGKNKIYFNRGLVQHSKAVDLSLGICGWAEGGSSIFDREKFVQLGGFDEAYAPFYWEDIDLSYNAWKSGYKVLFDPEAEVEHHHSQTIGKYFSNKKINTISYRNQFIFSWKNISEKKYCLLHIINAPIFLLFMLIRLDGPFFMGFLQALIKLPRVLTSRVKISKNWRLQDEEIFKKFG